MARKPPSLFGMFHHRYEAWLTEMDTDAELRIMECHTKRFEKKMECELRVATAISRVQQFPLHHEIEMRRLQLQVIQLDNQIQQAISPPAPQLALPAPSRAGLEAHVSHSEVEKLALRAVQRYSNLTLDEAEDAWEEWREELYDRYPSATADEIYNRAQEMMTLLR